jgi:hypothetical protein
MFNKKYIKTIVLAIVTIEIASLMVFLLPPLQVFAFFILASIFLYLCLKDLRYGALIIAAELILGSKSGYLFYLETGGDSLSIRITLWIIFLSSWLIRSIIPKLISKDYKRIMPFDQAWFKYFIVFGIFVTWGVLNGFLNNNSFDNIFFDFNSYLYFILIFPFIQLALESKKLNDNSFFANLALVLGLATFWISIKTIILLFLFSHNLGSINSFIYSWIRTTGVGEITQIQGGFYRIFFQSHIFSLIGLLASFIFLTSLIIHKRDKIKSILKDKTFWTLILSASSFYIATIISMSRTNWVGLLAAIFLIVAFFAWKSQVRGLVIFLSTVATVSIISLVSIYMIVKFPYPRPIGGFETQEILTDRASDLKNEAGVSSRWNLLPELFSEIKNDPIKGSGFGSTVTYISNDPRVRNSSVDGVYTTYAFEWGWLDIWLKLGLFGVISFLVFLGALLIQLGKNILTAKNNPQNIFFILFISIIAISIINFFSPYLNHPLGIGVIIFTIAIYEGFLISQIDSKK